MNQRSGWLGRPGQLFGLRDVGVGDLAAALVLGCYGVLLAGGLGQPHTSSEGAAAAVAVLLMTAPILFARRYPLGVAATLAGGAAFNWVVIGHVVRCGAALPAVFYVSFMIGSRCVGRRLRIGVALVAINVICQACSDPQLGAGVSVFMVPIALAFMAAGRLLRGRHATVARLEARTAELQAQRELNAQLAVAADQARIAEDLDGYLQGQVGRIAAAAAYGRQALDGEPDRASDAFVEIQDTGRQALTHMRGVVADLRDQALTEPQPVLAQLAGLLERATGAETRLRVTGDPRLLPPGVELSGCRIVEHLLAALDDDPQAQVDVTVSFAPDALQLTVIGPRSRRGDVRPALAAAAERAAVHGGTVRSQRSGARFESVARLPLVTGHA